MAKRRTRRTGELRTAVRLPADAHEYVQELVEQTGWSPPGAIAFLTRLGHHTLHEQPEAVGSLRRMLSATIEAHALVLRVGKRAMKAAAKQAFPAPEGEGRS